MNNNTNKKFILSEGYKFIAIAGIISLFLKLFISDDLANIGFVVMLFVAFVYRYSYRHIFENTEHILAPVDSKVIAIDNISDDNIYKIYCRVNLCNSHIVRAPLSSKMKVLNYQHGLNLNPNSYKANILNEQISLQFDNLTLQLISGICNISIDKLETKDVIQGEELGLFLDGIVIITVSNDRKLNVSIGDKLKSGQSVLFKK